MKTATDDNDAGRLQSPVIAGFYLFSRQEAQTRLPGISGLNRPVGPPVVFSSIPTFAAKLRVSHCIPKNVDDASAPFMSTGQPWQTAKRSGQEAQEFAELAAARN